MYRLPGPKDQQHESTQNPARDTAKKRPLQGIPGRVFAEGGHDPPHLFERPVTNPKAEAPLHGGVALWRYGLFFAVMGSLAAGHHRFSPVPRKSQKADLPLRPSRCSIGVACQAADASLRSPAVQLAAKTKETSPHSSECSSV